MFYYWIYIYNYRLTIEWIIGNRSPSSAMNIPCFTQTSCSSSACDFSLPRHQGLDNSMSTTTTSRGMEPLEPSWVVFFVFRPCWKLEHLLILDWHDLLTTIDWHNWLTLCWHYCTFFRKNVDIIVNKHLQNDEHIYI